MPRPGPASAAGAAGTWRRVSCLGQLERSAHPLGELPADRQPEPETALAAAAAAALEALEDQLALVGEHAGPAVADLELGVDRLVAVDGQRDLDRPGGRRAAARCRAGSARSAQRCRGRPVPSTTCRRRSSGSRPSRSPARRSNSAATARASSHELDRLAAQLDAASSRLRSSRSVARFASRRDCSRACVDPIAGVLDVDRIALRGRRPAARACRRATSAACAARAMRWRRTPAVRPPAYAAGRACRRRIAASSPISSWDWSCGGGVASSPRSSRSRGRVAQPLESPQHRRRKRRCRARALHRARPARP